MQDQAIEKINAEMQKSPDDLYTEVIGHYIIDRCADPQDAEKVAKDGKTMQGAMDAVSGLAAKKKKGNVAVLTPGQVFGEVDKYFGFRTDMAAQRKAMMGAEIATPVCEPVPEARGRNILRLEDFL